MQRRQAVEPVEGVGRQAQSGVEEDAAERLAVAPVGAHAVDEAGAGAATGVDQPLQRRPLQRRAQHRRKVLRLAHRQRLPVGHVEKT